MTSLDTLDPAEAAHSGRTMLLVVLTLAYTVGYIDRQILNLLVEPIRHDLGLSDVEISLLQGLSFSIGFLIFSPVFGRLAGMMNRRLLLMSTMTTWSIATALLAVARYFPLFFGLRVGIGAAEASISPLAFSMLGDAFEQKKIARAFSLFMLAPYIGGGAALLLGGLVYDSAMELSASAGSVFHGHAAWQITFLLIGIPSTLAAALLLFVREPARPPAGGVREATSPSDSFAHLFRSRPGYYLSFYAGMALLQVPIYVYAAWLPTTAIRVEGASVSGIGILWGATSILCGCAGTLAGPIVGNWFGRSGRCDASVRVPLAAVVCMIPCHLVVAIAPNVATLVSAGGLACFFAAMSLPVAASGIRLVTPSRAFGMATAVYAISVMIAGIAVAPTLVAVATQYLFGNEADVGKAVATICTAVGVMSALLLFTALRPFRAAAEAVAV